MGQVHRQAQLDRDEQCWAAWVAGETHAQIAAKRNVGRTAVTMAIARYLESRPVPEREAYRERCLERYERMYRAHADAADEWPRVAAIVRGIIDSEARVLGLVQSQVKVEHEGQVSQVYEPGPTVQELLEKWASEGRIKGVITR